jgi:hypothetical protein
VIPASPKLTSRYCLIVRIVLSIQSAPSEDVICFLLLSSDSIRFHATGDPLNVSLLAESCTWQDIQAITAGHSLLSASYSSPPTACLAVSLPKGRRDWVPTFHIALYAGGTAVPCRQLGDLQPDHMPITQGNGLQPINPHRSVLICDAYRHSDTFTISSAPSP